MLIALRSRCSLKLSHISQKADQCGISKTLSEIGSLEIIINYNIRMF